MSAIGDDQPVDGETLAKLVLEAGEMRFAGRVEYTPPKESLQHGGWRVAGMIFQVQKYFVVCPFLGEFPPPPLLVGSGHVLSCIFDAPLQKREGCIILVAPGE